MYESLETSWLSGWHDSHSYSFPCEKATCNSQHYMCQRFSHFKYYTPIPQDVQHSLFAVHWSANSSLLIKSTDWLSDRSVSFTQNIHYGFSVPWYVMGLCHFHCGPADRSCWLPMHTPEKEAPVWCNLTQQLSLTQIYKWHDNQYDKGLCFHALVIKADEAANQQRELIMLQWYHTCNKGHNWPKTPQ